LGVWVLFWFFGVLSLLVWWVLFFGGVLFGVGGVFFFGGGGWWGGGEKTYRRVDVGRLVLGRDRGGVDGFGLLDLGNDC
jgi:hypothetical protein